MHKWWHIQGVIRYVEDEMPGASSFDLYVIIWYLKLEVIRIISLDKLYFWFLYHYF